jgi:hypothetical protein
MATSPPSFDINNNIDNTSLAPFLFLDAPENTRLHLIIQHATNTNIETATSAAIAALLSFVAASWTGPLLPTPSPLGCLKLLIVDNEGLL